MLQQVKQWFLDHKEIRIGDKVVVGLSGGGDSVCLLCLLKELETLLQIEVSAVHIHHGIRGKEADHDASFCRQLCGSKEIPFQIVYADVPGVAAEHKISLEEAGRKVRYESLEKVRQQQNARWIAVAHHREDNAETVLWNLFRGTGLNGLGGMDEINGAVIRPLLSFGKQDILRWLESKEISWCQDATNEEDAYTRNRIRHHVLPYAADQINEQATEHICHAAGIAAQAHGYLHRQAEKWLLQYSKEKESIILPVRELAQEEPILRSYIFRCVMDRCVGLVDVTARHIALLERLLEQKPGGAASRQIRLGTQLKVVRCYETLQFCVEKAAMQDQEPDQETAQECVVYPEEISSDPQRPTRVSWGKYTLEFLTFSYDKTQKIPTNRYTKWLDYDKIREPFRIRARRSGDYFLLDQGGRKTIKAYMIDEKIPVEDRACIPMGTIENHVLWIGGYRISNGVKLTETSQNVLQIQMYGGEENGTDSCVDS